MTDLGQNGVSHGEVLKWFRPSTAISIDNFALYAYRNKNRVKQLNLIEASIECNSDADIKYAGVVSFEYDDTLNYATDRFQLYQIMDMGGIRFEWKLCPPLRVGERTISHTYSGSFISLQLYDESSFLQNNRLGKTLAYPKNTLYITIINDLMALANFTDYTIVPTDKVINTNREFEEGDELLALINELLKEINYTEIYQEKTGFLISKPYEDPLAVSPSINYMSGNKSLVTGTVSVKYDTFRKPNVFIGYVSNPDIPEGLRAMVENEYPSSALSTVTQGYRITDEPKQYDHVADQETLERLVYREMNDTRFSYHTATFNSYPMPHHEVRDIISIDNEFISGIFEETNWSISVNSRSAGMSHKIRSLYGD